MLCHHRFQNETKKKKVLPLLLTVGTATSFWEHVPKLLHKKTISISGVATETAQFIFKTTLAPKLNYGLELVSPNAYRATILDNPQIAFTYLMLSQPTAKRSELLQAEVGMVLTKYSAAKKIITMQHHWAWARHICFHQEGCFFFPCLTTL